MRLGTDPGVLRTQLTIEACSTVPDGMGGHAETWTATGTVMARIEPVAARQRFAAGQTLEATTHRILMRHRSDVEAGMRFRLGDRIFAIETVHDPDETGRYLLCQTRETTP